MNHHDKGSEEIRDMVLKMLPLIAWRLFGNALKWLWRKFGLQDKKPIFVMYARRTTSYVLLAAIILLVGFGIYKDIRDSDTIYYLELELREVRHENDSLKEILAKK